MARIQWMAALLVLGLAAGCKAQSPAPADGTLDRHIEVMVRAQFNIPQDYVVTLGRRTPSQIPGYETLPVTLAHSDHSKVVNFLISTDNKTLARFETFDIAGNPVFHIDISDRPIRGNPAAKVTVVNFDDLECPYCARMHQTLFHEVFDRYKDKVRFIYKDNPLVEIHPWATRGAVDAHCLAAQSGEVYWQYIDYVHNHGQEINGEDRDVKKSLDTLDRIARQHATVAKLDDARLDACIAKQDDSQVRASIHEVEQLHVEGAPAVFVDGELIMGALGADKFSLMLDRALRAAGVEPPPAPVVPSPLGSPPAAGQQSGAGDK